VGAGGTGTIKDHREKSIPDGSAAVIRVVKACRVRESGGGDEHVSDDLSVGHEPQSLRER